MLKYKLFSLPITKEGGKIVMEEKRKEQRLKDENEISVTIVDDEKKPADGKSMDNHSIDISMSGVRIKSHVSLPVDTLITIKMKLKNLGKVITHIGKVKWNKGNIKDKSYEAGVEFVDTQDESNLFLQEYISRGVDHHVYKDE
jgi:hypothetical protein